MLANENLPHTSMLLRLSKRRHHLLQPGRRWDSDPRSKDLTLVDVGNFFEALAMSDKLGFPVRESTIHETAKVRGSEKHRTFCMICLGLLSYT